MDTIVGKNIRRAREDQGLLVSEVARRAGLTVSGVQFVEQGKVQNPTVGTVMKIAEALGVDPGDLLTRGVETAPKVVALPRTPLADTAPEDLDALLENTRSTAAASKMLVAIEAEERDLVEFAPRHIGPKLDRARLYRMAITDRWVKLADKKRDPASNRFKTVSEVAEELGEGQEWLKDRKKSQEEREPSVEAS
jgi:transcriptional regulator with XRE-family HTH domain